MQIKKVLSNMWGFSELLNTVQITRAHKGLVLLYCFGVFFLVILFYLILFLFLVYSFWYLRVQFVTPCAAGRVGFNKYR